MEILKDIARIYNKFTRTGKDPNGITQGVRKAIHKNHANKKNQMKIKDRSLYDHYSGKFWRFEYNIITICRKLAKEQGLNTTEYIMAKKIAEKK